MKLKFFCLVLLSMVLSCNLPNDLNREDGSAAMMNNEFHYDKKIAHKMAYDYLKKKYPDRKKHVLGSVTTIEDDGYFFTVPTKDDSISKFGVFVNGNTGQVIERKK